MNYKVVLKKCQDEGLAQLIATETAQPNGLVADDDEEFDANARVLSDAEYSQVLGRRGDIFRMEKESRLRNSVSVCLTIGLCIGLYMSTIRIVKVASDFLDKLPVERQIKFVRGPQEPLDPGKIRPEKKPDQRQTRSDVRTFKNARDNHGSAGNRRGGGDPRERVTQQGILALISGKVTGKAIANADIFGKGGFQSGIDGIILGLGGLKSGGYGGVGRKGPVGIGFGTGVGSGFGEDAANAVGDLIDGLFSGEKEPPLDLKDRGILTLKEPVVAIDGGKLMTGGRSRASIMRVVMQNISALRYAYNKRLREKPGLRGKITCKFAIDEFGKVIFCELIGSTMADPELEAEVKDKISRWVFEKLDKPGDVTEVQYPFAFSQ